jgi:hypothetical protein
MRVVNLRVTHPRADYSHTCDRCQEPICLFPSGQRILREHPGIQKLCDVCGAPEVTVGIVPPEVDQERRGMSRWLTVLSTQMLSSGGSISRCTSRMKSSRDGPGLGIHF